jgi:acyl-coenzyme A thioesterase PaaI-like protein
MFRRPALDAFNCTALLNCQRAQKSEAAWREMHYNFRMATKQPNSRMCFICGLENPVGLHLHIYETEPGVVETTYVAPEHFQGYPGVLHGGIVGAIIDEISGRALMGDPGNPRFMFTAKLEVRYRKNVPIGKPLKIIGRAGKSKSRSAEAWAGIYEAETGELLAEGTTLLMNVPADQLATSQLSELGWKVYPESSSPSP